MAISAHHNGSAHALAATWEPCQRSAGSADGRLVVHHDEDANPCGSACATQLLDPDINPRPAVIAVDLAEQTGDNMQYVADLVDIVTPQPQRRQLDDPEAAAALLSRETIKRVEAVCGVQAGDPVVLLSGGVDSILVAAAAVKAGHRPRAITVTTANGTDQDNAAAAAKALGLAHDIVSVDERAVVELARETIARLGLPELWEVSYAIPLLAATRALDQLDSVGPILSGCAADAIFAGGTALTNPVDSPAAVDELDRLVRTASAASFRYQRLVPDFHERVIPEYASRFTHIFQTLRFWTLAEQLAPPALFGTPHGTPTDKLSVRLACTELLPESASGLAWAKKSAIQKSAGIMGSLAAAARHRAADLPGAKTYTDPETESWEAVATRLFLALLAKNSAPGEGDPATERPQRLNQSLDPIIAWPNRYEEFPGHETRSASNESGRIQRPH